MNKDIARISNNIDSCCNCSINKNENIYPPGAKPCDYSESMAGGKGYKEIIHQLGNEPGYVLIDYNMLNIPDRMDVYYNDQLVASTENLVSGTGSLRFYYPAIPGEPAFCKIVLRAPKSGTQWEYHIGCPR